MSDEQQRWPEPVYLTKDHAINMTLRDYFAAKALGSCGFTVKPYNTTAETAEKCYAMADAMLKAREQ